jgi:hypothetical protein
MTDQRFENLARRFGAIAVLDAIAGFSSQEVKFGVGQLPFSGALYVAGFV